MADYGTNWHDLSSLALGSPYGLWGNNYSDLYIIWMKYFRGSFGWGQAVLFGNTGYFGVTTRFVDEYFLE